MERDNRELERSLQVAKQTSERVGSEMEKTSRRLTAQIHADKKEIARLKEVSEITNLVPPKLFNTLYRINVHQILIFIYLHRN